MAGRGGAEAAESAGGTWGRERVLEEGLGAWRLEKGGGGGQVGVRERKSFGNSEAKGIGACTRVTNGVWEEWRGNGKKACRLWMGKEETGTIRFRGVGRGWRENLL